jgi:flavodoxin
MKVLIIYFSTGGRTKKMANIIGKTLETQEVYFFSIELSGSFFSRLKTVKRIQKNDFSAIEDQLDSLSDLEVMKFDLLIVGMPTYDSAPPKVFDEILSRSGDLSGKKAVVFSTARFTGKEARDYLAEKLEAKGAEILEKKTFRGLLYLRKRAAQQFGKKLSRYLT